SRVKNEKRQNRPIREGLTVKLQDLCPVPLPENNLPEDIVIEPKALKDLVPLAKRHLGNHCVLLADPDTLSACDGLNAPFEHLILPKKPMADTETINQIIAQVPRGTHIVALGGGTINDLAKRTSQLLDQPYIIAGTAASMNGYASGIAAILDQGLKTTVPAAPPRAIILDTEILAQAPAALAQAGLGDLISKPVSDTDWWLAGQLGEADYSELPGKIVQHAMERATANPTEIRNRCPSAHGALGEALVLSGIAMVVAGSSSPASGGEHLISHLWDMENIILQRPKHLHGAQVGVTTCISAAIYSLITEIESPEWVSSVSTSEERRRVRRDHPELAEIILGQALSKHSRSTQRLQTLQDNWSTILAGLRARQIPKPDYFKQLLKDAGAPCELASFNHTRQDARRTLSIAKDIRDRFTVLDLATDLGLLPSHAELILQRAGL
ncbi:MAG: iron-containing alcohol dehydrogenase, partial [Bradymonadia bacterium]